MTTAMRIYAAAAAILVCASAVAGAPPLANCGEGGFPCVGDCESLGYFPKYGLCWNIQDILTFETNEGSNCSHQYKFIDLQLNFDEAEAACSSYAYHLAGFETEDQVDSIAAYFQSEEYWIGLRSEGPGPVTASSFEFTSGVNKTFGDVFDQSPWNVQAPVNDPGKRCVAQKDRGGGKFWQNMECSFQRKVLCQKTVTCMDSACECGHLGKEPCDSQQCAEYLEFNAATGTCESCGGYGEPLCSIDGCLPGLVDSGSGECTYCGVRGAPPCQKPSGEVSCSDDNEIDEYSGLCMECGGHNQPVCKSKLKWKLENTNGCSRKCCPCNGIPCFEWSKDTGSLLVGNECQGEFEFGYSGEYPNANITIPKPVTCASTGQGEAGYQTCDVGIVPRIAMYCNSAELFPVNGKCMHECSL